MKLILPILIYLSLHNNLQSQVQVWDVLTFSNQPYSKIVLDTLINDTLHIKVLGNVYHIPVDSIVTMKREKEAYIGTGVTLGVLSGMIIGANVGGDSGNDDAPFSGIGDAIGGVFGTFFGALIGGVIGGSVGAAIGMDESYNFKIIKHDEKLEILKQIIFKIFS